MVREREREFLKTQLEKPAVEMAKEREREILKTQLEQLTSSND